MIVLQGNTATAYTSATYPTNYTIKSFRLVNKSAGVVTVNMFIRRNIETALVPKGLQMDAGDMLVDDTWLGFPAGSFIKLTTTGSLDYFITLEEV